MLAYTIGVKALQVRRHLRELWILKGAREDRTANRQVWSIGSVAPGTAVHLMMAVKSRVQQVEMVAIDAYVESD